jgi:hypothetical protein
LRHVSFRKTGRFRHRLPHAAPSWTTLKTLLLFAALLAYFAGFVILYPIVANSVAESVSEGNDPALLQFVGP